ncbi:hypothetical protein K6119_19340 [Paracrocinitomix mangrovi]|uniref:hypothetical protein n=1 Tax=Paracrocinitomix mangrovi TaxID=2862509 RepID=UPI001C8EEBEB|nr:hypothetical protein [Paracrocinitomix mangrovi]UKN01881.1 hypothetical protein K6119_19340 [Paracrocinitomix mangrovi]
MDEQSKRALVIVLILAGAAVGLFFIFKFWWTFLVAAVSFLAGYFMGKSKK